MSNKRKVWFITRPERDPKFHVDALKALESVTENFTKKWKGNRTIHKNYEKELVNDGLKRNNISNDGSGGRTWVAMIRNFGYVYLDRNGYLVNTKVGKEMLNSNKIKENVTKQILTFQIPNSYFLSSGFKPKFEEGFEIRPVRFLIKLVLLKELNYYLTKEEITFFALTAKNDKEVHEVKDKILIFRSASNLEKLEMKKEVASIYEHRERSDRGARDFEKSNSDVTHTFMLLCDYTEMVNYLRGDALRIPYNMKDATKKKIEYFDQRYPFNKRYLISLERFSENAGLDIDSYKANIFGDLPPATNKKKSLQKVYSLLSKRPTIANLSVEEVTNILKEELSTNEAKNYAIDLTRSSYNSLNDDFVESYLYEKNNYVFEDKTGEVFQSIGFEVEMRPKPQGELNTEIEILLHIDDSNIAIFDAKNYREKFALSSHLASHMASEYIPNHMGYKGKNVSHFGYITASRFTGVKNLKSICNKANRFDDDIQVKGTIYSAKALLGFLDYCLENNLRKEERKKLFINTINNTGYNDISEMPIEKYII